MAKKSSQPESIGDVLRARRVEVLKKGLREMARQLDIAPAHLTDLETGRRSPSEELLVRLAQAYGVPVAELRAGWKRPSLWSARSQLRTRRRRRNHRCSSALCGTFRRSSGMR